jgi:hypothetical protein
MRVREAKGGILQGGEVKEGEKEVAEVMVKRCLMSSFFGKVSLKK